MNEAKHVWLSQLLDSGDINDLDDFSGQEERDMFGIHDEYDELQDEITSIRKKSEELSNANQELQQKNDEHKLRIGTFKKLFYLMVAWLISNFVIIVLSGSDFTLCGWHFALKLTDPVLITLLGTTTFNVLGIFAIAAKWLFPKK